MTRRLAVVGHEGSGCPSLDLATSLELLPLDLQMR
jgi:hypothetical protein